MHREWLVSLECGHCCRLRSTGEIGREGGREGGGSDEVGKSR